MEWYAAERLADYRQRDILAQVQAAAVRSQFEGMGTTGAPPIRMVLPWLLLIAVLVSLFGMVHPAGPGPLASGGESSGIRPA